MPRNILIINPYGIGDVLFSTPLIRNLRFYYPNAFIAVAVQKNVAPILDNNPYVNRVIAFSRGDFKELRKSSPLKAVFLLIKTLVRVLHCKFNLCIDLSLDHRYSLFLKFFGIKPRIGYNYKNRGRFLNHSINIEGYADKHVVEYLLELLKFLGLKPRFFNLEVFLTKEEKNWARIFLSQNGVLENDLVVGLLPGGGASWGEKANYLQWPYENFAKVCDELQKTVGARILLFGSKADIEICQNIMKILRHKPIELCGRTNLRQFISLLDRCNLVICNDTGPLHISTALGKRLVCLCGPVDERVYGPYPPSSDRIVIKKDFPCRPCYKKFQIPNCDYEQRCLRMIDVDEVIAQAKELFAMKE